MLSQIIVRGENALVTRTLKQADGSPLLFSALTYAAVRLYQGITLRETLVLGTDAELRAGSGASDIVLELTSDITLALSPGALRLEWRTNVSDAAFIVDSSTHKDAASDEDVDVFEIQ